MKEVPTVELNKIAQIKMGQSPDSRYYNTEGNGTPFLQGCAQFGKVFPFTSVYCTVPNKIAPQNSILFGVRAPVGEINLADREYCIGRGLAAIIPKNIDEKLLYYLLLYTRSQLAKIAQGSTFEAISANELETCLIPDLGSKLKQSKIAEVLSTIDLSITQIENLIAKYQRIKNGLMQDLFSRGIEKSSQLRSKQHRFKPSPIGMIPEEWNVEPVKHLFKMELGKMMSKAAKQGVCPKPYLANKNVQWGWIDLSEVETMDFFPSEQFRLRLKKNDILICEGGEVGRTAIWKEELEECYFQKAIHRLNPLDQRISSQFMAHYMEVAVLRGVFQNLITQTSIAHLTQEQLAELPVCFPDPYEMQEIVDILGDMDENLNAQRLELAKLHRQKTGLMQDLLTGKVPVKPLLTD